MSSLASMIGGGAAWPSGHSRAAANEPQPESRAQVTGHARAEDDEREGQAQYRERDEREPRHPQRGAARERAFSDAQQRFDHEGDHRGLEPEEQAFHDRLLLPEHVGDGQRHDREEARQHEQQSRDQAAADPVQQPADVGRELLRFGAGQQHAVTQRVQEPLFADPAFFLDQDAMHDGDLPGGAAERQQADAHPGARGFGERHGVYSSAADANAGHMPAV